ncbi:MAG: DUF4013 domain-containing protein [Anaerolineaceae bacterium]|nr:DUF4013 domain-containing protein [Anaerolineaceae bacterium]
MNETSTKINLGKLLSYPFKDKKSFEKILIGSAILLVGVLIPILPMVIIEGYLYRMMKRVISGDGELEMPEWNDFGKLLSDGIKLTLTRFIYYLPLIFLIIGTVSIILASVFLLVFPVTTQSEMNVPIVILFVFIFFMGITLAVFSGLFATLIKLIFPLPLGQVVATDSIGAAFKFNSMWKILKCNFVELIIVYVLGIGFAFVGGIVYQFLGITVILLVLLPAVTFLLHLYSYALYALAYRKGIEEIKA